MISVVDYYANNFGTIRTKLNQKEIETLNELSQKYSHEELIRAINKLRYRPKPAQLEKVIIQALNGKNNYKQQEEEQEKETEKWQKPQQLTSNDIPNNIPNNYKKIFIQYNIPKNLIDTYLFSSLDEYLKKIYLADIIAEYIYSKLPKEKLSKYNKKASKHFSKIKLSEREKEKAYKSYIKLLIKKDLGIYV